jgi:hypothetical protein
VMPKEKFKQTEQLEGVVLLVAFPYGH